MPAPRLISDADVNAMARLYEYDKLGLESIGRHFGCSHLSVRYHLKRRGVLMRGRGRLPTRVLAIDVSDDLLLKLETEARTRGTDTRQFAAKLLSVLVRDKMIGAVLDE